MKTITAVQLAKFAAKAADDKLAKDVIAYDVRKQNAVADIYMFMGATSHIHVRALEDGIRESMKEAGGMLLRTDGQRGHLWRVLDYGIILIHIMEEKTRQYYSVERLWEQGKKIPLFKTVKPKKALKTKKTPTKKKSKK